MATYTKNHLSGGLGFGRNILVVQTGSGTLTNIHTPASGSKDEIWLWLGNNFSGSLSCSLMFGGTSGSNDNMWFNVPGQDQPLLAVPGFILSNTQSVSIYAQTSSTIWVNGFVNSITP